MKRHRLVVLRLLAPTLLIVRTLACAAGPDARPDAGAATLAAELRRAGLTVEDAGMVEQPFFGVPARVLRVDEEDVQVYELSTAAVAEEAAAKVAPNGMSIVTAHVGWMAPPHFFRRDRLIVNYLGSKEKTLAALKRLLGPQFAGQ